jgi:hypothetical protein
MTEFGKQLRRFRHRCNDPRSPHGKLTQEKFGELVGGELGISYSGAAVSDWERGKSKIHADDRPVLMALIQVLYKHGGVKTTKEANQLLEAGNYRALDPGETQKIFTDAVSDAETEKPVSEQIPSKSLFPFLIENLFSISGNELQTLIAKAEAGPSPSWPRWLAAFLRKAADRFTVSVTTMMWIWVWLFAWWLIAPSLRWPFANRIVALQAVGTYVAGALVIPLLIGLLIDTKNNDYWQKASLSNSTLLRLYTYQGAGIGFNLGYFFVFPLALIKYYLQLETSIWLEFAAATFGLILGNMSARIVPHNLWLAYGRLHLADGAIFFVVALLGPIWGVFFLQYYSVLLTPFWGSIVILVALTLLVIIPFRGFRKTIDTE